MSKDQRSGLAAEITRAASAQSYFTIRLLADRELVAEAFRAYAYFRWVDDTLDAADIQDTERLAFLERQRALYLGLIQGDQLPDLTAEEEMLAELLSGHEKTDDGLCRYLEHMMAVMAFDAGRRGRHISQHELQQYTHHLAVAVTEALHHFIGNRCGAPKGENRYLSAAGAHVVHMLRDSREDSANGYYNIPRETMRAHNIGPLDFDTPAYRNWVRQRIQLARGYFRAGRAYLARVESLRCRLAGYAYIARFECLLDTIEHEGYQLRLGYPERKSLAATLKMAWSVLWSALGSRGRALSTTGLDPEVSKTLE
jgi:phytoene/squalene synthetase